MPEITLEAAQAKLDEAQASVKHAQSILEQVKALSKPSVLRLPEALIELRPGERYAGTVLDIDGKVKHHLVLLPDTPDGDVNWENAMKWAQNLGGSLPTRQEQALLFANCKPHLQPCWHWSCESHESNASSAWYCYFGNGNQSLIHKSASGAAVAVRRLDA